MRLAILLLCSAVGFGQSTTSPPETKAQAKGRCGEEFGLSIGAHGQQGGSLDILSDTQGVDFGPYLQRISQDVRENWYHLIPESAEMKKGKLAIEFAIRKDGKLAEMCLVDTSGDVALDRAAWEGITASNPFLPLPSEFTGPYLAMRFRFSYNPDKSDLDGSVKEILPEPAHTNEGIPISSTPSIPSKSGVAVNISSSGDSTVPTGESRVMIATVTGAKKKAVKWSISGLGCANSSCGEMVGNLYLAPSVAPNPSEVTLTAVSKADPTAKASVIIHIVEPTSKIASKDQEFGLGVGAPAGKHLGAMDILSDTQGMDFGPYLRVVLGEIRKNWFGLVPESEAMKKGKLAIEFAITKDGKLADMRLVATSGDTKLDRAAWGGITASDPFKPLPDKFTGPYLTLRMRFYYNPDKSDLK